MIEVLSIPGPAPVETTRVAPRRKMNSQSIKAFFDAAQTTDENSNHWSWATINSPDAALRPDVRRTLRNRARYEVANNSYGQGIVQTLTNWIVGTGPTLRVSADNADAIEAAYDEWARATGWYRKLWTMVFAFVQDGEAFSVESTNYGLDTPVKLDVTPVEADRFADPRFQIESQTDGIILDDFGNPAGYTVLRQHPGDRLLNGLPTDYEVRAAREVRHLFRQQRPGQHRGVSMLTPALPLFAMMRQYTLAVLAAADNAADISGVIHTQGSAVDPLDLSAPLELQMSRRAFLTMPYGWTIEQLKAEQPATTYAMFKAEIIGEIGRAMEMPYNVAALNSGASNFASGKLDHVGFFRHVAILQWLVEQQVADTDFAHWFDEAKRIDGYLEGVDASTPTPRYEWMWDGADMLDSREAGAQEKRLNNGTTTMSREYAKVGLDWQKEQEQSARELGLTIDEYRKRLADKRLGPVAQAAPPTPPAAPITTKPAGDGEEADDVQA